MHGICTPAFSVPLRVTMSWKHTPQASTLITTSFGPAAGSAIVSIRSTSVPPGARTTMAFMQRTPFGLNFSNVTSGADLLEHRLDRHADAHELGSTPTGLENSRTPQSSRTWITV